MLCTQAIGRADEVSWLSDALDDVDGGRGRCMFLVGEAGIGKSRLVAEAVAEAGRRGMSVLAGQATVPGSGVPYQPLTGAFLQGLRSKRSRDIAGCLPPGMATLLLDFVDGPALPASPVLLAEIVLRLARVLGDGRGTFMVLEDVHWADADTMAVIEHLADNSGDEPIAVLATARPEGRASILSAALDRRAAAMVRTLLPLTFGEVGEMVASCLGEDDVPRSIIEEVDARAKGIPFLVEEWLAGLVNRGAVALGSSGWQLNERYTADVPDSFTQTVGDRLAQLGRSAAAVLRTGAVMGRDIDWHRLGAVGGVAEEEVRSALSRAIELQLVEKTGRHRFRFRHALTVEAILAGMLDTQRARLAAQTLDKLNGDNEPLSAELVELAAHLAIQADRRTEAAQYLTEEARGALAAGAVATAEATARQARDLVPASSAEAIGAEEVMIAAQSAAGDTQAVDKVGTLLLSRLEDHGAGTGHGRVWRTDRASGGVCTTTNVPASTMARLDVVVDAKRHARF
jgi:predicted ATPase